MNQALGNEMQFTTAIADVTTIRSMRGLSKARWKHGWLRMHHLYTLVISECTEYRTRSYENCVR